MIESGLSCVTKRVWRERERERERESGQEELGRVKLCVSDCEVSGSCKIRWFKISYKLMNKLLVF